jgi:hypothetical protein
VRVCSCVVRIDCWFLLICARECRVSEPSESEVKPDEQKQAENSVVAQSNPQVSIPAVETGRVAELTVGQGPAFGASSAVIVDAKSEGVVAEAAEVEPQPEPEADEPVKPDFVPLKDDPVYGKYFKMMKCGIPKEAVAHKMVSEGLNPAVLDCDPNGPLPNKFSEFTDGPPLEEDPVYSKYFKV